MGILFNEEKVAGGDFSFTGRNIPGRFVNNASSTPMRFENVRPNTKYLLVIMAKADAMNDYYRNRKIYNNITGANVIKEIQNTPYNAVGAYATEMTLAVACTIALIESTDSTVTIGRVSGFDFLRTSNSETDSGIMYEIK